MSTSHRHHGPRTAAIVVAAAWLVMVAAHAWLGDDAFITLRTVEAFLRGDGLVWNPGERVQAYTHPAWMFTLAAAVHLTGDAYLGTVSAGVVGCAVFAALVLRGARTPAHAAFTLVAATLCKSLVHYGTSGLENPLAYALLAWLVLRVTSAPPSAGRLRAFAVGTALLLLCRPDLGLLVAPSGLLILHGVRPRRAAARALVPGVALLLAWLLFATFYYGAPLPNTAYAKLGTGIPRDELLTQGFVYLRGVAAWDPLSVALLVAGVFVGGLGGARAWALGIALYVGYVVSIGGGFMLGRFFTFPAIVALALLARAPLPRVLSSGPRRRAAVGVLAVLTLATALVPNRTVFSQPPTESSGWQRATGLADEQAFYHPLTGLSAGHTHRRTHHYGRGLRMPRGHVEEDATPGLLGYGAAERAMIIDPIGLTDPFLARLPTARTQVWRIGHVERHLPDGYVQSVRSGECRMHFSYCPLFDGLREITRGPLWSSSRLQRVLALLRGELTEPIDMEVARRPRLVRAHYPVDEPVRFGDSGLRLEGPPRDSLTLELGIRGRYRAEARADGRTRCVVEGARVLEVRCDAPFDTLLLDTILRPPNTLRHTLLRAR